MTETLVRPADVEQVAAAPSRPTTRAQKERYLLAGMLAFAAFLAGRLRNTAFVDEALHLNAGHAYLDHWFEGGPLGEAGQYSSGAPTVSPALAAALDSVGGLYLVRAFSLLCILMTALLLRSIARHLWGPRAGLLTAAGFLLVGPVIYVGWLATNDALAVVLLTSALWLGVVRRSYNSAVLQAVVLTLAATTKYTAGVLVPIVLTVTLLLGPNALRRVLLSGSVVAISLTGIWLAWGETISGSMAAFAPIERGADSPVSVGVLLAQTVDHFLLLVPLALLGLHALRRREHWRVAAAGAVLLGAAALFPIAQLLESGESGSFEKHLAYSAMFLVLPIGFVLARISRRPLMFVPVVVTLMMMSLFGLVRAGGMYEWTNVRSVVNAIELDPRPGLYLSSAAEPLDYHTRGVPGVAWETTFALYFEGSDQIERAVADERYQAVIVRTSSVGDASQDAAQAVLLEALEGSRAYDLAFEPFPAGNTSDDLWLFYTRR